MAGVLLGRRAGRRSRARADTGQELLDAGPGLAAAVEAFPQHPHPAGQLVADVDGDDEVLRLATRGCPGTAARPPRRARPRPAADTRPPAAPTRPGPGCIRWRRPGWGRSSPGRAPSCSGRRPARPGSAARPTPWRTSAGTNPADSGPGRSGTAPSPGGPGPGRGSRERPRAVAQAARVGEQQVAGPAGAGQAGLLQVGHVPVRRTVSRSRRTRSVPRRRPAGPGRPNRAA